MADSVLTLFIGSLWNGEPAQEPERAQVLLALEETTLRLVIYAPFHGDPAPEGPPGSLEGLWNHEVVEVFIAGPGEGYTEIEIGPHGHHLVLRFEGPRNRKGPALPLDVKMTIDRDRWAAVAHVDRASLPPRPWTVNAYAIHGVGADRRYLSCHPVPGEAPDFHRLEHFRPLDLTPT